LTLFAIVVAATPVPAESSINKPLTLTMSLIRYAYTASTKHEFVFVMGNMAYRTVAELEKGVERLPRGSKITWAPGCIIRGGEPLSTGPERTKFRDHCEANGVIFSVIPSG